ncbi:MAG: ribosome biogenesis GTPase Der [Candidatus Dasytiphilus stammeri]
MTINLIPRIALVGRPNVGKSTLFNKITTVHHHALVTDCCNMTRDRNYGISIVKDSQFIIIDTGGIDEIKILKSETLGLKIFGQFCKAIEEANLVLFIVDAYSGLMPGDHYIMKFIRSSNKPLFLVVNKIDGLNQNLLLTEFCSLGLQVKDIFFIAASSGRGINKLLEQIAFWYKNHFKKIIPSLCDDILEKNSVNYNYQNAQQNTICFLAIVGRPNVGKSTLINRLLGEERVIVFNRPGTTRDSIYVPFEYKKFQYILIDTAGLRKYRKVLNESEKLSIKTTIDAIYKANVVIMVIDASHEAISDQDLSILRIILKSGRSLVLVVNKWDTLSHLMKRNFKKNLSFRLRFVNFVHIHFISALCLSIQDIDNLFFSVREAYYSSTKKFSSRRLTQIMKSALEEHQPPIIYYRNGSRSSVKLKYAHSGGYNPPIIVIHGSQVKKLPNFYKNYLKNYFRRSLDINGTLIKLYLKES